MSPMVGISLQATPQMCTGGDPSMKSIKVQLSNRQLWEQFHCHHNEMIITKTGRRMFPSLQLSVTGLEPDSRYFIMLEMSLSSGHRFKYSNTEWLPVGKAEPQLAPGTRVALHPDSPALGSYWTSQPILFQKIRLTNNSMDQSGNIILTSMHKYLPRIHIVKASDILAVPWSPTATFTFKETEFTAVTAYQNDAITKLKIDNNPFAKGFRENGQSKTKRKSKSPISFDEPESKRRDLDSLNAATNADDSGISSISSTPPPQIDDEDEYIDVIGTDESDDTDKHRSSPYHESSTPFSHRNFLPLHGYFPYSYPLSYFPCPPPFNPLNSSHCLNKYSYLPSLQNTVPSMYPGLPYPSLYEKHLRTYNSFLPTSQVDYQTFPSSYLEQNLIDLRTNIKSASENS